MQRAQRCRWEQPPWYPTSRLVEAQRLPFATAENYKGASQLPLTSFEKGKLKIAAHVREELDRAGIGFESIRCRSGGTQTHRDTARVTVTVDGHSMHLDLNAHEVEECELLVMGDTWRKIAGFIERLK